MMNKSKNSKVWSWKVATFLPLLVLLLMAFSRKGENFPEKIKQPEKTISTPEIIQKQIEHTSQIIEIKNDGNYIDNKQCTLEEIVKKGQEWRKASNAWIHLLIYESIPFKRIDEVRGALNGSYWVTQSTVNSDEIVYFSGDVSQLAKFKNGKFNNWLDSQIKNYPGLKSESREYVIHYSIIIDKNGKVRDGHIIEGCDYPDINATYDKILTQIPDWEPARRGSNGASVYYYRSTGHRLSKKK